MMKTSSPAPSPATTSVAATTKSRARGKARTSRAGMSSFHALNGSCSMKTTLPGCSFPEARRPVAGHRRTTGHIMPWSEAGVPPSLVLRAGETCVNVDLDAVRLVVARDGHALPGLRVPDGVVGVIHPLLRRAGAAGLQH